MTDGAKSKPCNGGEKRGEVVRAVPPDHRIANGHFRMFWDGGGGY